jgi:hypothetical protein
LRKRGIDVLTAQEGGTDRLSDRALLARATALERLLVTYDQDFLALGRRCQVQGEHFCGSIFVDAALAIGQSIDDLELLALAEPPERLANQVRRIPL